MNDNCKLWVETLEGDEFTQTQRCLRTNEGYCCLGVATELFRRATGKGEWVLVEAGSMEDIDWESNDCPFDENGDQLTHYAFVLNGETQRAVLPDPVKNWIGLREASGHAIGAYGFGSLASDNDSGASFNKIAKSVKEHSEVYLTTP